MKKPIAPSDLRQGDAARLQLEQAVEAFRGTTGLDIQLLASPSGPDEEQSWRVGVAAAPGKELRRYRPLLRSISRREALGAVKVQLEEVGEPGLLVAPRLSSTMAQHCRAIDLPFIDGQGNGYLAEEGLLVFVTGQKATRPEAAGRRQGTTGRSTGVTGLKLVFALLCDPALTHANSQSLKEAAGVGLASVSAVVGDLEARGQLADLGWGKGWQVRSWSRLLDDWVQHYPLKLRPKLRSYRFRSPGQGLWWKQVDPGTYGGQWGGEVAASQLGSVLVPERAVLYLQPEAMRLGVAQLVKTQGLRSDPQGDVEVVEGFWSNDRLGLTGDTVPIPLVIADLQASLDGRNIEAARELREIWLRGVEG